MRQAPRGQAPDFLVINSRDGVPQPQDHHHHHHRHHQVQSYLIITRLLTFNVDNIQ